MSLKMWLPLNKDDGNDTIINNGIEDYDFKYDNTTKISLPDSVALKSICYGGGKYIYTTKRTGKNGNIYSTAYSTDGITWTSMHIGDADWKSVCYGNGKFVAVTKYEHDTTNIVKYSEDGINWHSVNTPSIDNDSKYYLIDVCYGNGKFVAINFGDKYAIYSTDGINWLRSTMPADNNWHGICYGNGKFVATCNSSNMAAYSTDGINWAKTTLPNSGGWNYVCYGNGKFVTFDMGNNIAAYSTDGINWTQTTLPTSDTWNGICYGNGKFVTVSNNRNGVAVYSTDGITWTQTTLPVNAYWNDICYGNGKFVAVASNNMIAYSYNGIIWRNISSLYTDTANLTGNTAIARLLQVSSSSKLNTILAKKATISFRYFNNTLKGNISGSEKSILFSTSEDNTLYIKANTSDSLYFALPTKLTANDWNTITLTIDNVGDNKSLQVYLNGKLEATKVLTDFKSELDDTANLYNIAYNISPSYLVDYRIYDEILLEKEIKELALFTVAHFPLDDIDATPTHDLYFGKYENGNMNVSANEMITKKVYDDHTDYTIKGNLNPLQSALTTNVLSDYFYNDKVLLNKIMVKVNRYKSGSLSIKSNRYENDDEGVSKTIIDENCDVGIWKEYDLYNSNIKDYIHYKDENGIIKTGKKISDDVYQEYNPYLEISGNDISIEKGTLPDRYTIKTGLYDSDEDKVMIPVNGTNKIITSSDKGRKWNIEELPETTNNHWNGIAKNDNIINITDNDSDTSIHSIYSTNNGNTWNKASKPLPGGGTTTLPASAIWFSVCYGNGKFVAVTMNNNDDIAAYSTDGIHWTQTTMAYRTYWSCVCYGDGKFVAVSRGNYYGSIAAYSTDGINWTKTTIPSKYEMQSVCYGNGKFVAVSGDEDAAYSTDGINWTGVTMPGDWWCSVCYGNGKFVAVTMNRGIAAYSTDGINWTKTTISSDDWQSVCYGNGKFVAIANGIVTASNIAAYSTDGITWTKTTLPATASWHNVCYGDGKFVAVAYDSNLVAYSTDGINWKQITMPNSDKWYSVCYGDGKFVTLTNGNNLAAYSTDGITWSSLPVSCKSYGTAVYKNYTITVSNLGYYYLKQVNGEVTTSSFISKAFDSESIIYNDLIIPKVGGTLQQITNMTDTEMTLTSHTLPATYTGNQLISNIIHVYNDFYLLTVDCTDHILVGSTLDNITKVTLPESLQNKVWKGIEYFGTTIVLVTEDNKLVFASYKKKEDKTVDITINESNIKTINKTANSLTLKVDKELMVFPLQELEYSIVKMYTSMIDMDISIKKIQCIEDSNENAIALPYVENDKIIGEWKTSTLPTTARWYGVCYGNGKFVAVTTNNIAAYSTDGINWTSVSMPSNTNLNFVCYGNGKFVAVYGSNKAAYSTDGINWTQTTMPVSANWQSVCYGDGKFVAISYTNIAAYSTDGINWTQTTLPTSDTWNGICYGNGKFVAVTTSTNNKAAYSTDGINWTKTTMPVSANWQSVCYGDGKFVAVAYNSSNVAAYSTDGIKWTQTTMPVSDVWRSVCYGNGKFVTVTTSNNNVAYSTDGINWKQSTMPSKSRWYGVCYGNGKFVAVVGADYDNNNTNIAAYLVDEEIISSNLSDTKDLYYGSTNYKPIVRDSSNITMLQSDNKNYYISDGYSLVIKKAISSNDSDTFSNIFRYKDKDYAINTSDNAIWENDAKTSDEIKNNTFTKNEPTVDGGGTSTLPVSAYWSSVCYGDDKFVAICSNGSNMAAYSTDGITWTKTQLPIASDWISVCYGNDKFVAIINNANFDIAAYSTDGINWTKTTLPVKSWWQNVCYGNGKFVAVASNINNIAIYSTDGIHWTQTTLPVDAYWWSVCYGNGKFVAVSYTNIAAYSTDCINWTKATMPNNDKWRSVCYGNGKYVAVAYNSSNVAYSTDGINWTKTTMPVSANWQSVCYGDGKYVAVAWNSEYAVYSIDGINWTQTTLPVKSNGNICYGGGKFIALAYDGNNKAAYSIDGINWTKTVSYNTIPLTNYKLATTVDKFNNLLLLTNKEAFICPNTGDILKDTTAISTSTLSTDKLGTYISAVHSNISVFVSSVPTSSSYHGVCITTTKEGTVNTVTSIILPVKPPYKSIIVREGKFLVLPSTGNQLCVSPDGNKWDTIDLPVAGPYSCLYYDTKNILYLTLSSSDSIYYTRDLIHWHNYLLPEKVNISNVITNVHSTVFVTNNSTKCYYINMPETEYYYNDTPDISDYDGSEITVLRPTVLGEISPVGRRSLPMYREIPTMGTFINNVITVNSKFSISLWMNIHDLAPWYDISEWLLRAKITENNYGLGGIHTNHIDKNHMINSAKYFDEFTKGWNLYTLTVDINKGSSYVYINDSLLNSFVLTDAKSYFNNEIRISINGDINIDISDFKVYNKALTKDEISYIYNDTITNDCSAAIYSNNTVYSVGVKELADPFANNLIPITTDFEFYDKIHFGDSNVHSSGTVHHKIMVYHNFNSTIEPNKTSVKLDLSSISHMVIKGKKYIFSFKTQIPNISNLYYTIKINGAADSITDISNHTATASGKYVDISIPFTATGYDKLSIIIDYGATIGNKVPNDLYIGEVKLYPIDSDSPYIDKVNGIVANQIYESDLADEVTFAKDKIVCNKFITK